jgi:hypothetical protein
MNMGMDSQMDKMMDQQMDQGVTDQTRELLGVLSNVFTTPRNHWSTQRRKVQPVQSACWSPHFNR